MTQYNKAEIGRTAAQKMGKEKDKEKLSLGGLVCDKCSLPVPLYSSNSVEKLCDEWVLSTSVCGTGSFSAHTATHSISGNAHETQSFSTELRKTKKVPTNT